MVLPLFKINILQLNISLGTVPVNLMDKSYNLKHYGKTLVEAIRSDKKLIQKISK